MKYTISNFALFIFSAVLFSACGNFNKIRFSPYSNVKSGVAPTVQSATILPVNSIEKTMLKDVEPCDTLLLKSGETILGAIRITGKEKVTYVECDNQKGPDITIKTSSLQSITFSSGTLITYEEDGIVKDTKRDSPEVFIQPAQLQEENNQDIQSKRNLDIQAEMSDEEHEEFLRNEKLATQTLLFGGMAFIPLFGFIFGIIALVKGSKAMKNSLNKPGYSDVYADAKRGRKRAIIALSLGFALIVISLVVFRGLLGYISFN